MVDIKVGGPAAAKGPDKKKQVSRPAGGPSFASLLDETTATAETAAAGAVPSLPSGYVPVGEDDTPQPRNSKQQAHDLMDNLQQLAEDVLAGQPTAAARKLEAYLQADVTDMESLSAEARQALDELSTRVAVAVAKTKQNG